MENLFCYSIESVNQSITILTIRLENIAVGLKRILENQSGDTKGIIHNMGVSDILLRSGSVNLNNTSIKRQTGEKNMEKGKWN